MSNLNLRKRVSAAFIALVLLLSASFVASFAEEAVVIDFTDAESFEKALNNGEDLTGKTVRFVVNEYKPDSVLGYNCWAGEHLNFISAGNLNVKAGDIIEGKVLSIGTAFGSWEISYEVLTINGVPAGEEANEKGIRSLSTEEVLTSGEWVPENGGNGVRIAFCTIGDATFGNIYFEDGSLVSFTWEVIRSSSVKITPIGIDGDPLSFMYACVDDVPKLLEMSTMEFFVLEN